MFCSYNVKHSAYALQYFRMIDKNWTATANEHLDSYTCMDSILHTGGESIQAARWVKLAEADFRIAYVKVPAELKGKQMRLQSGDILPHVLFRRK